MINRILFIFIFASVFLTSSSSALAQTEVGQGSSGSAGITAEEAKLMAPDAIMPPYPRTEGSMPFSGQNHFYSLVFRGNGESIVTLRVALTNTDDKNALKEVTMKVPKVMDPQDLSSYQILVNPPCIRYLDRQIPVTYPYTPTCAEYGEPDYYHYYGGGKYQKADITATGDTLKIVLPTPVAPNKTGSFFVYFRGFGYASKDLFGAYKYDFESFKVEDQINQVTVGISTDADQYLKGAEGEVEYSRNEASVALKAMPAADAGAVANPTIDRFIGQTGYGQITKTASNLASNESYKVEGKYAKSRTRLYAKELVATLGAIVLVLLIMVLGLRFVWKKLVGTKVSDKKSGVTNDSARNFALAGGISFASALVATGYTVAIYAVGNLINDIVGYQYQALVMILLLVISFAVYLLILVGPAFYLGYKNGAGWGIWTFVMTIIWLVLFAIVAVILLFVFRDNPDYPVRPFFGSGGATMEKAMPAVDLNAPVNSQ